MKKKSITGRLISASSEESADILYASGFTAPDSFIYFSAGKEKAVIVSPLEYSRALDEVKKGVSVLTRADFLPHGGKGDIYRAIAEKYNIGKWLVPARFPLATADSIRNSGIGVEAVDGDFFPSRARKTREEIAAIASSMKATEEAMMLVYDLLKKSKVNTRGFLVFAGKPLTCDFIRNEVETEFKRKSFSASRTIIACGKDGAAPHNIGSGAVKAEQPIVADIFPKSDISGYWGDMTRTFVKGKAPPVVRKAFDAVKKASETALQMVKPGVPASEIHFAAAKSLEKSGFATGHNRAGSPCGFFHGLGHGVGLEIHENPRVSPLNPNPLEAGNVISIEPGLYYPSWGGIRLEDLVLVTKSGYRNFCTMPKELEIP